MVQRILGARSINDARTGTLLTALLKILPLFILVLPGLIAVSLFPEIKGDDAYPVLIASDILPSGIKGFVIAGFLAAIMSSLSGAFNSISALYTLDFYKPKHADASERTLVLVGRMVTIVVVVAVLLLIPFVKIINSQIYIFLQSTQAYISAPISAIFLFGLTLKKIDSKSVFITFIVGEFVGLSRFVIEVLMKSNLISDPLLIAFTQINYLHFTIYLFVGSALLLVVLSYGFRMGAELSSGNLTAWSGYLNGNSFQKGSIGISNRFNLLFSGIILIITLGLWSLFI
jgi:SSS family solute:Na+ symporter